VYYHDPMATLKALAGDAFSVLQPEHLVGRGGQCNLRLSAQYVSTQHALIRWNGEGWELVDRGSRNGTFLDGVRLDRGTSHSLSAGSVIAFGHPNERWAVADTLAPQVCVLDIETNTALIGADGVIGVPSDEEPQCTVYRDTDGCWKLESADTSPRVIEDGHVWETAGKHWRFSAPRAVGPTATSEQSTQEKSSTLCFAVSPDEEFVHLTLEFATRKVSLGSRAHNYLLLLLARARATDRDAGLSETTCGWLYKEDLADALRTTPEQVDGEVHRIRKHFAQHGLEESATIVERRPRTKQLRLGTAAFRISRL
jgi:hypothetical protein